MSETKEILMCTDCGFDDNRPGAETCSACGRHLVDYNKSEEVQEEKEHAFNLKRTHKSGANWFYWIGGLSLLNTVMLLTGGSFRFVVGSGTTTLIDSIAYSFATSLNDILLWVLVGVNAVIAAFFVWLGVCAHKKQSWAFLVGMVMYSIDSLPLLLIKDFFGFGFHIFALTFIFRGYQASKELLNMDSRSTETVIDASIRV